MTPNAKLKRGFAIISFGIPVVVVAPAPISFRRRPSPTLQHRELFERRPITATRRTKRGPHIRSARSATRPERTRRATRLEKILREKSEKRRPNSTKKRHAARGDARLRARREPPSINQTEHRKKKRRAARQTVNPFPSVLLPFSRRGAFHQSMNVATTGTPRHEGASPGDGG